MLVCGTVESLLGSSLTRQHVAGISLVGVVLMSIAAAAAELPAALVRPPCVACQQPAGAGRELFSATDWTHLENGDVVIIDRTPATTGGGDDSSVLHESEAAVIVPRPATEVWAVLADFESRPKVFPNVSESRIERVDDNRAWIQQSVDVLWTTIRYTLITTLDPAQGLITFALDPSAPHDIRDNTGSWQLLPHGDASTLLLSRDRVDSGKPVPGVIENYLLKRSLPTMMSNVRDEVERRASFNSTVSKSRD